MDKITSSIWGLVIGDALGVPVEFLSREELAKKPVTTMVGYGSHNQPPGTWSDDTSMTLATMESIITKKGIDYNDIMHQFVKWYVHNWFTPFGKVFDCGITTGKAIMNHYIHNVPVNACGETTQNSNGNGSLMRMLPVALYTAYRDFSPAETMEVVHNVSALTHAHPRSLIGCTLYALLVKQLLLGKEMPQAIDVVITQANELYRKPAKLNREITHYKWIGNLENLKEVDVPSTGYIVDSLKAAMWCTLTANSYKEAVLKAVNLGKDTDTIGAIAGSLAGLLYEVPQNWINRIQKQSYVANMINRFIGVL